MKKEIKKQTLQRLKILEGQIRGLQRMVEKEEYCIDILQQSLATKNAISRVESLMLENHLSTHVVNQIKAGKETKSVKELLLIYRYSQKK